MPENINRVAMTLQNISHDMLSMSKMIEQLQSLWSGHKNEVSENDRKQWIMATQNLDYLSQNVRQLAMATSQLKSNYKKPEDLILDIKKGLDSIELTSTAERIGWKQPRALEQAQGTQQDTEIF